MNVTQWHFSAPNDGVTIRTLTPQDVASWKVITQYQQVQENWVKTQEAKGVKDAAQTLKQVTAIMKESMKK